MSTVAYLAVPVLVLVGVWALLTAYDEHPSDRRSEPVRLAVGALLLAAVAVVVGVAADSRAPAPAAGSTSSSA